MTKRQTNLNVWESIQFVGFKVLTAVVMKRFLSWDITLCSPKSADVSEQHVASEISVDFQRNTWRYIPEDRTLYNQSIFEIKLTP
jgi:hypothetical protein